MDSAELESIPRHLNLWDRLEYMLEDEFVCQKRLDSECPFVIMRGSQIWKGPYPRRVLQRIRQRCVWLCKYQVNHVVLPIELQDTRDGPFLIYENLDYSEVHVYKEHTEKFSGLTYRLIKKMSLITLQKALIYNDDDINEIIRENIGTLFCAILQCYILGLGDLYFTNMLLDLHSRNIYIIDLDDLPDPERCDEFFYLRTEPSPIIRARWLQWVRPLYDTAISFLEPFVEELEDPDHLQRARLTLLLLRINPFTASLVCDQ